MELSKAFSSFSLNREAALFQRPRHRTRLFHLHSMVKLRPFLQLFRCRAPCLRHCIGFPWNFRKASAISHDAAFQKGIPRALPKHCQPSQSIKSLLPASPQANRPTGKTANRDSMNVKPLYVGAGRGAFGKSPSPVIHYTFCNTQDTLPRMRPGQSWGRSTTPGWAGCSVLRMKRS